MDPRVVAVRESPLVGRGTCSTVDECYSDATLTAEFDEIGISSPKEALVWSIGLEDLLMDRMMDQRFGEDSDPEVKVYQEWEERKIKGGWK